MKGRLQRAGLCCGGQTVADPVQCVAANRLAFPSMNFTSSSPKCCDIDTLWNIDLECLNGESLAGPREDDDPIRALSDPFASQFFDREPSYHIE